MARVDHSSSGGVPSSSSGPTWPGRRGNLAYLAKMFPRDSETLALWETLSFRRQSFPLRIYSILPPTRDTGIQDQARALLQEVVVLPQPGLDSLGGFLADLGYCLHFGPFTTLRELTRVLIRPGRGSRRRLFLAVSLAAQLHKDRVTHVHAAGAHIPASVVRVACRILGIPWSMGVHSKDIHLADPTSLAGKLADAMFTTVSTRFDCEILEEIGAFRPEDSARPSIHICYRGVDTEFFTARVVSSEKHPVSVDAPVILSVGHLVARKGFDTLLQAAGLLRDRWLSYRLEIVGEGPLRKELEDQIRSLGLDEWVRLRGVLSPDEIRRAYGKAVCVALASRIARDGDRDGIPNTLAEAMATGVPVVSTRLPSIEELVKDDETGLLVPPDNPRALAHALERILRDPSLAHRLGRAGQDWIRRNYDSTELGQRLVRRLERTLGIERTFFLETRGIPVTVSTPKLASVSNSPTSKETPKRDSYPR